MLSTVVKDPVSKIKVTLGALLLAVLLSAVLAQRAEAEPLVASYYGTELAGNPTASGEIFDPYGFTAAHPSLPFGTQLEVCYQGCATVTVNDRGPFVGGRGLDLSLGAAQAIGLTGAGVGTVDVTILGSGGETAAPAEESAPVEEESAVEPVEETAALQPAVSSESGYVPEISVALDGSESAQEIADVYANAYADAYTEATGSSSLAEAQAIVSGEGTFVDVFLS